MEMSQRGQRQAAASKLRVTPSSAVGLRLRQCAEPKRSYIGQRLDFWVGRREGEQQAGRTCAQKIS